MTREERVNPDIIDGGRRSRIARGSGTSTSDVSQLVAQFRQMRQMLAEMGRTPKRKKKGRKGRKGGRVTPKGPEAQGVAVVPTPHPREMDGAAARGSTGSGRRTELRTAGRGRRSIESGDDKLACSASGYHHGPSPVEGRPDPPTRSGPST
ncbi:MAG: hypothetical protein M5U19_12980 [Microthrixaceae bacterium]|nr:hypothetical protein [Microthrixaceae bacterium]